MLRELRERKLIQRRRPLERRKPPGFFRLERPRQLWQLDLTSVWVADHGSCYLIAVIDCCTREIVASQLGLRRRADEAIAVVERAAAAHGIKERSGLQLGWVDKAESRQVGLILIAFPFLAQLLASIWSTLARDGVAATAMGVLALTWLATGLILHGAAPGQTSDALGLLLLFSGTAMALTASVAAMSKLALGLVFLIAAIRFALGGLHQLTGAELWENAAGVVGLILLALVLYGAFAAELEDARSMTILPLGRRLKGRLAMEASLDEQMKHAPNEPGVRQQL